MRHPVDLPEARANQAARVEFPAWGKIGMTRNLIRRTNGNRRLDQFDQRDLRKREKGAIELKSVIGRMANDPSAALRSPLQALSNFSFHLCVGWQRRRKSRTLAASAFCIEGQSSFL